MEFGIDNPASRVVTGLSIKSSDKFDRDPASVVVSYLTMASLAEGADNWESLDEIDLHWEANERYTENVIELWKNGSNASPETTAMRFEFTAKEGENSIAVQQIQFYGISRQKALYYEYGKHCSTLLYYRDEKKYTEQMIFDYIYLATGDRKVSNLNRDQFDAFVGFCDVWKVALQDWIFLNDEAGDVTEELAIEAEVNRVIFEATATPAEKAAERAAE